MRTCDECGYTTNTRITLCPSSRNGADCMGTLVEESPWHECCNGYMTAPEHDRYHAERRTKKIVWCFSMDCRQRADMIENGLPFCARHVHDSHLAGVK